MVSVYACVFEYLQSTLYAHTDRHKHVYQCLHNSHWHSLTSLITTTNEIYCNLNIIIISVRDTDKLIKNLLNKDSTQKNSEARCGISPKTKI